MITTKHKQPVKLRSFLMNDEDYKALQDIADKHERNKSQQLRALIRNAKQSI